MAGRSKIPSAVSITENSVPGAHDREILMAFGSTI
jgi:hypothetical protein